MRFKFAFRNLLRMPWRTLLYMAVVLLLVMAMMASLLVYHACADAKTALEENYLFVASLVPRDNNLLGLQEAFKCLDHTQVKAFNVSMSQADGVIPCGQTMFELPSAENKKEAQMVWDGAFACKLVAVENLSLVYPFFSGECVIREGEGLTRKGYAGERNEILIPWWLAEEYGISVGDSIVKRYFYFNEYIYSYAEVVGIYESSLIDPDVEEYPAYIPLAIAEVDYDMIIPSNASDIKKINIERADYILKDRSSFSDFVTYAKENGVDFRYANLLFNNSTYDVLFSELDNIHMIALFVCIAVLFTGIGVICFFTVYLCNSRKQERELLRALGMGRGRIRSMIALEIALMLLVGIFLGAGLGYFAADGVCSYVNQTVLERASASEQIQLVSSAAEFESTMPLEKNMKIEISTTETRISTIDLEINDIETLDDSYFGITIDGYTMIGTYVDYISHSFMSDREALKGGRLVAMTDITQVELSVPYDEIPNYFEGYVWVYINENSPYLPESYESRNTLYIMSDDYKSYVEIKPGAEIGNLSYIGTNQLIIAGTYKDNEYCSGDDILIRMEDYNRLRSDFTIMTEEYHFQRIGSVHKKGGS